MSKFDLIVSLGSGFTEDWKLPSHVYPRLRQVAELYKQKIAPKVAVCGKWSINWDLENVVPPITESELIKQELIKLGVQEKDIYKEEFSKDTIGNAYFLKTKIIAPKNINSFIVTCADFHLKRVKFLFAKIFTDKYHIEFLTTETDDFKNPDFMKMQDEILDRQNKFLENMRQGDDSFLASKLYSDPYYLKKRPANIAEAAKGETK
ncbi:MAG TPA: YdcF family protein [Candidatus Nitrosocosmicus sp.]|nr:YdcF family protein [Candidatus Nitrosocosmicus sp.]